MKTTLREPKCEDSRWRCAVGNGSIKPRAVSNESFNRKPFITVCLLLVFLSLGCAHDKQVGAVPTVAPFQQYVAPNIDWSSVKRVLVMPLANQTAYPKAAEEMQTNLAAELQRAGRFDIVVATHDDAGARARDVFARGQFDELELLRVAREYQADAVLFGQMTQYHPYNPPRVGLSLLMVSPSEGIVIASSDGLWDARESSTADLAKNAFSQSLSFPQSIVGADRVLESPEMFQRFVSHQVATSLVPPAPAFSGSPNPFDSPSFVVPASAESQAHPYHPNNQ